MSLRINPNENPSKHIYQALFYIDKISPLRYDRIRGEEALLYIAKYNLVDQALRLGYGIKNPALLPLEDKYALLWWVSGMSRIDVSNYRQLDFSIGYREFLIEALINTYNKNRKNLEALSDIELIYLFIRPDISLVDDMAIHGMTGYVKINFKHPYNAMFAATHINLYQSFLTNIRCIPPYYIDRELYQSLDPKTISLLETMNIDNLPLIKNRLGLISYDNMFEKKDVQRWSRLLNRDFKQEVNLQDIPSLLTDYETIQYIGSIEIPELAPDFPSIPIENNDIVEDYVIVNTPDCIAYAEIKSGVLDGKCIECAISNYTFLDKIINMEKSDIVDFLHKLNIKFWRDKEEERTKKYMSLFFSKSYIEEYDKKSEYKHQTLRNEREELLYTYNVTFKNGILNGSFKTYYTESQYSLGNMINGERDGLWLIATPYGKVFRYYKRGIELSEFEYAKSIKSKKT